MEALCDSVQAESHARAESRDRRQAVGCECERQDSDLQVLLYFEDGEFTWTPSFKLWIDNEKNSRNRSV